MIIGILQPGYMPWLGFMEQVFRSDMFVVYDDVQYDTGSWRNRNRIKSAAGIQWLTVPVLVKFCEYQLVNEVKIDNKQNWKRKHLSALQINYAKAPFFKQYFPLFQEVLDNNWQDLIDLDFKCFQLIMSLLGISKPIYFSSELGISGGKVERLINICKHFGADTFYEGAAGANYINPEEFTQAGLSVKFQNYKHPIYNQLHGEFIPYLSVLDLLFNEGDKSLEILTSNQ